MDDGRQTAVVAARITRRTALNETAVSPHVPLVPTGLVHATRLAAALTLCGLLRTELQVFPGLLFAGADFLLRCPDCLEVLGR